MVLLRRINNSLRFRLSRLPRLGVERGLPPSWFGYRWVETEPVRHYLSRTGSTTDDGQPRYQTIHPPSVSKHPLPRTLSRREQLPDDAGWWHYSFRDVPERVNGETYRAILPNCRVAPVLDPDRGQFWVTIVNRDGRALDLREMAYRPWHAPVLRSRKAVKRKRATWIFERVYDNHSHWLTAHLPKLLLLRERGELENVLMPETRSATIDECLEFYGFEAASFDTFRPGQPIDVEELTVYGTDRFRPELLRLVGENCPVPPKPVPSRRVLISRAGAARRRLVNEEAVWEILKDRDFERVKMEKLSFAEQVRLMRETSVLVAPHGAGLTNMLFCSPGAHIVEIADLGFPNPNFYATAAALRLPYSLLSAKSVGDAHPLEKDLWVDPALIENLQLDPVGAGGVSQ